MADERNAQDQDGQDAGDRQHGSRGETPEEERLIPEDQIAEDGQVYVDREKIDFDPEEGLYSGTAVHGGTDIPGPHEQVDDIDPNEAGSGDETDTESDAETEAAEG